MSAERAVRLRTLNLHLSALSTSHAEYAAKLCKFASISQENEEDIDHISVRRSLNTAHNFVPR